VLKYACGAVQTMQQLFQNWPAASCMTLIGHCMFAYKLCPRSFVAYRIDLEQLIRYANDARKANIKEVGAARPSDDAEIPIH